MQLPVPEQNLKKTRVDFRPEEFRKLVQQKGYRLLWQQRAICPCSIKTTANNFKLDLSNVSDITAKVAGNSPSCPVCKGKGFIAHSSQQVKGIVTHASDKEEVLQNDLISRVGGVNITLEPEHLPSYGDLFTMVDAVRVYREVIEMPAVGNSIITRQPIVARNLNLATGQKTVAILYIHKSDVNGNSILNGEIVDTDFTVNVNTNTITFTNNATKPAANTRVSVTYYTHPTYVATEFPHTFRDTVTMRKSDNESFPNMLVTVKCRQVNSIEDIL